MKTTIDIPDRVFRQAKAKAAERGVALREYVTEALQEKLAGRSAVQEASAPPWMRGFGRLRALRSETAKIQRVIDQEFEVIEPEDRQ